jgi:hypothetical protein
MTLLYLIQTILIPMVGSLLSKKLLQMLHMIREALCKLYQATPKGPKTQIELFWDFGQACAMSIIIVIFWNFFWRCGNVLAFWEYNLIFYQTLEKKVMLPKVIILISGNLGSSKKSQKQNFKIFIP